MRRFPHRREFALQSSVLELPTRPNVTLRAAQPLVLGQSFGVVLELNADRPTQVDFVDLRIERRARQTSTTICATRLREACALEAGVHTLSARLALPSEGAPSYAGLTQVEYVARVHISVPWWPDRKSEYVLHVVPPGWPATDPKPRVFSPHPGGAPPGVPSFDVSLADSRFVPGGTISGVLALTDAGSIRYGGVSISVVGRETSWRAPEGAEAFRVRYDVAVRDARKIPFRLKLDDDLQPSWRNTDYALAWQLEVRAHVAHGQSVDGVIPIDIAPKGSVVHDNPRGELPRIGDERIEQLWIEAAQATGLTLEGNALMLPGKDRPLTLSRQHGAATRFAAVLRFPDLGLHLDGGLFTGFRRFLNPGVDISESPWGSESYVTGRDETQVKFVAAALAESCFDLPEREGQARLHDVRLDDLSDETLTLSVDGAGNASALRLFADAALRVLRAAQSLPTKTPPPASFGVKLEDWQDLAKALRGPLQTTHMGVAGRRAGESASVRTRWSVDGRAVDTEISVSPQAEIDTKRTFRWAADQPVEVLPDAVGEAARETVSALYVHCATLIVEPRRLTAYTHANEPLRALEVVDLLLALALHLRTNDGPFR